MQDLDLALVVGETSFGKGLVQRIYNINDTTSLKVTTSKYYTPSGRLIQKMDYLDNENWIMAMNDLEHLQYSLKNTAFVLINMTQFKYPKYAKLRSGRA